MSIQSQDVFLNTSTTLTVIGSGGGGAISTYSTFTVSSLNALNLTAGFIESANISSMFGEFDEIFCSSISTLGIIIDDQILTAVGNELLLNGIPIATNSSLSSIADWSLDAAISTLNMNSNSSINASLTSTNVINAGSGRITNLVCDDISTTTLTVLSTLHVVSTISSVIVDAQAGLFSSINGLSYPPPNSDVSQWATFPAVSTITGGVGATDDLRIAVGRSLGIEASVSTGIVIDRGIDIGGPASFNVLAKNGSKGAINLRSDPGFAGLYGEINLTANGGTTPGLIGSGGLITLTANTPIGTDPTATSAIKLSAAGINSYAGAVPSFGSLLGYNFIYGTLGVNLCAGLPSVLPNVPGTTYLYGTSGITLGSQTNTGSDITQSAGGLYTTLVTGYWAGGVFAPQNLVIRGRQIPIYGNSYVQLSNVDVLSFDSGASKAITGLSTINGVAYPPAQTPLSPNLIVSSLTAAVQVSTPALFVSSVNGGVYPPVFEPPADAVVSTLTAANFVSTPELFVSSVNGSAYPPTFEPPADAVVSTLTTGKYVSTPELFVSSVNGDVYPPVASVPADLTVSTITLPTTGTITIGGDTNISYGPDGTLNISATTAVFISSALSVADITVSSINGGEYPPAFAPPTNLIISSLVVSSFTSTLSLTVSSINGYTTSDPAVSTLSVAGAGNITLQEDPATTSSAPIFFKSGNETINEGILQVRKAVTFTDPSTRNYTGLAVGAYSTLGSLQPVICASILLNPTPNVFTGAPITGNTAGDVIFPMSSILGISTINGVAYPPASAGGIQSTIANSGSFIDIDSGGNISSFSGNRTTITANSGGVHIIDSDNITTIDVMFDITMTPTSGAAVRINQAPLYVSSVYLSSINGSAYPPAGALQSSITNAGSLVNINGGGSIFVSTNASVDSDINLTAERFINIDATSINCLAPTSISSLNVSSINGGLYGVTPSSIANGGSFVNIDSGGNIFISTASIIDKDINLTAYRYVNIDATLFNCPVNASIPEITSVSSINGAPYKPSTFTQASISSLTVSTINNNQVQGPVWKAGGTYSNPNVTFSTNTNTLISYTSTTTTTSTAKNMIFATFEATTTATGTIYMTIARSVIPPTAVSSFNLTNGTSALTNAINGSGLSMWGSAFNTSRLTAYASVVDTPGAPGTYYYSVWGYDTASITTTTSELTCLTVLNVAP